MHPYLSTMSEATRLTRAGNLQQAVQAIQKALGQQHPTNPSDPAAGSQPPDQAANDPSIIDVAARVVSRGEEKKSEHAQPTQVGRGEFVPKSFSCPDGARDYKLFIPPNDGVQALPLVVMLHGCTQDPDDFAAGTGMNEAAATCGMYVLYPAQIQGANPSRCWNWFKASHQARGRGEPAILAAMVRDVLANHNIDPQRVYVAGLSAGGAMAAILGEAYPELFAAVGVHSGLAVGAARDVPSAFSAMKNGGTRRSTNAAGPPTIVFHGDKDATVHHVNGQHVVQARVHGATGNADAVVAKNGRRYTRSVYKDGAGRIVAEHWLVHGAGHAWFGGSRAGSYTDELGPSATEEMLRFFGDHRAENT